MACQPIFSFQSFFVSKKALPARHFLVIPHRKRHYPPANFKFKKKQVLPIFQFFRKKDYTPAIFQRGTTRQQQSESGFCYEFLQIYTLHAFLFRIIFDGDGMGNYESRDRGLIDIPNVRYLSCLIQKLATKMTLKFIIHNLYS